MFRRLALPFLALGSALGGATAATAPNAPAGAALRFMEGECDRLAIAGRPAPRGCQPALVSLVYASGAVSFVFAGKEGRLLSFRTRVDRIEGEQTQLKVDQITLVPKGGGAAWSEAAAGSCVLTPFAVDRSRIECSARAGGSRFAAVFRTSDARPRLVTLAGG